MRVLVVEDHRILAAAIEQAFREAGYAVDVATDGETGLALAETHHFDALVLDWMLPKLDGIELLRRLRGKESKVPVLLLTARDEAVDQVRGLDAGADDYLVKPFEVEVLLAHVRALIRRSYHKDTVIRVADLEVNTAARSVSRGSEVIALSAREYAVLEYLAMRKGQTVSRAEFWEHLYDFSSDPGSNVIDVYVANLRRKIDDGREPKLIHTRRGLGYVLSEGEP